MYDIEINGTSYPVKFGMNFIKEIVPRFWYMEDKYVRHRNQRHIIPG
nr:MAG TPA: tail assembly chaperone protein [Caudoviricetes sp.]